MLSARRTENISTGVAFSHRGLWIPFTTTHALNHFFSACVMLSTGGTENCTAGMTFPHIRFWMLLSTSHAGDKFLTAAVYNWFLYSIHF